MSKSSYNVTTYQKKGYRNLIQIIFDHALTDPHLVAMRQKKYGIWKEISWIELENLTLSIAASLKKLGVTKGMKIGILSENRQEWVLSQFGINCLGGLVVGMYPTSPSNEIEHLVNSSETTVLFIEDQEQLDKIIKIKSKVKKLQKLIIFEPKGCNKYSTMNLISFESLLEGGKNLLEKDKNLRKTLKNKVENIDQNDTAMMMFTSGSTGLPKAAEISFYNLWFAGFLASKTFMKFKPGANILSYLPLCHIAEQNMTVINCLTGQLIMNFGESLRTIRQDLREVVPDLFFGVPRIWQKLQAELLVNMNNAGKYRGWLLNKAFDNACRRGMKRKDRWNIFDFVSFYFFYLIVYRSILNYSGLSKNKLAITAAAPISPELLAFMRGIGIHLIEVWGMTETTGAATIQPDGWSSDGRVGYFFPSLDWKIASDGELLVKGGSVFKGYFKDKKSTEETIKNGWLHTGDIAEEALDGSISIIDRKKDIMINSAGKNITPTLIENALKSSPYIKESIVVGDGYKFVTALIQIDFDTVRSWAEQNEISYTNFKSLSQNQSVISMINDEVYFINQTLASVQQIKKIYILPKELDHDDGEVTATMKIKRKSLEKFYNKEIQNMYR